MSGDQVIQRCRIEYFQMLIGLNSPQRPTSVPFPSSGVSENLRSQLVELRRYVDHLEAERNLERKRSEAIMEVGTKIDAGQRGTPIHVEESLVEKEKERLAENEEMLKRKEKELDAERALIESERNNLESERKKMQEEKVAIELERREMLEMEDRKNEETLKHDEKSQETMIKNSHERLWWVLQLQERGRKVARCLSGVRKRNSEKEPSKNLTPRI